jgi:hypothetical protein
MLAAVALLSGGLLLDHFQGVAGQVESFYCYRLAHLWGASAWLVAIVMMLLANADWLVKVCLQNERLNGWQTVAEASLFRLFFVNFYSVPVILGAFIVLRQLQW